jgi:hypothetical protein
MIKIGKKRTLHQVSSEEPLKAIENDENEESLKRKRGIDGKIVPLEQRVTETE